MNPSTYMYALLPCHCCSNQSTIRIEVMNKEIASLCGSIIKTHLSRTVYPGQAERSFLTSAVMIGVQHD